MKKSLILTLSTILLFGLVSCGTDSSKPAPNPDHGQTTPTPKPEPKPDLPTEDYTVKTESTAGAFNLASYTMSVVDPNDASYSSFDNEALEITINRDDWSNVTALNDSETKILSKNENVIPVDSIEVKLITMTSQHDDNTIKGIKLLIDRTKIKVGETFIKVHFKPSNGSSSAEVIDLCVPVKVVEYGTIKTETTDISFKLNINNVDSTVLSNNLMFVVSDNDYKYGSSSPNFIEHKVSAFNEEINITLALNHELSIFMRYELDGKVKFIQIDLSRDDSIIYANGYYTFTNATTSKIDVVNK